MRNKFILFFILLSVLAAPAQTTLVLQPGKTTGSNSEISNYPPNLNNNYGNYGVMASYIWTNGADTFTARALLQFDLSSIPGGATITEAYLDLYASPAGNTFGGILPPMNGTNNASYLRRVNQPWNSYSVTWSNQPSATNLNQIILPTSNSNTESYLHIDVTLLVGDMMTYGNNGFMIQPVSTEPDNSMLFNTCNFSDSTLSPRLTITYTDQPICLTLRPDGNTGKDAEISSYPSNVDINYGNYGVFASYVWDFGIEKALIAFDLSSIPADALVTDAQLDLYADIASTTFNTGEAMYGTDNASYLRRIAQPWDQNTVTWSNQPSDTSMNEVILPTSTSPNQNYLGIEVTSLIQDMLTYGNNGFMIEPVSMQPNNSMIFRSSDYPDSSFHPELRVCYTNGTVKPAPEKSDLKVIVYPNPFSDKIMISFSDTVNSAEVLVFNNMGQLILKTAPHNTGLITITRRELNCPTGLVYVRISEGNTVRTFKLAAIE